MAARAIIAKLANKGIKAIYSHSDNYLEPTGKILDQHYHDVDKIDELIAHGDLSIINENIGVKLDFNDYDLFHKNKQCRFYYRDRGEDYNKRKAEVLKDETELLEFAFEQCDADLVYMYAYGSWYVYDNSDKIGDSSYQFIELEEALYNVLT